MLTESDPTGSSRLILTGLLSPLLVLALLLCAVGTSIAASPIDRTFGNNGAVIRVTKMAPSAINTVGLEQTTGGGLRLFARVNGDLAVFAYRADGSLDQGFRGRGFALLEIAANQGAEDDSPQATARHGENGTIVVGGVSYVGTDGSYRDQTVARVTDGGRLDPDFGFRGSVRVRRLPPAMDVAVDSKGRIVTVAVRPRSGGGLFGKPPRSATLLIARYLANGKLDRSFDRDGIRGRTLSKRQLESVSVETDSRDGIWVNVNRDGSSDDGRPIEIRRVVRYGPSGQPDSGFGFGGAAEQPGFVFFPWDIKRDEEGRMLVSGNRGNGVGVVLRYADDGRFDPAFGVGGAVTIEP